MPKRRSRGGTVGTNPKKPRAAKSKPPAAGIKLEPALDQAVERAFVTEDYEETARLEVQEPDASWRESTLYRHRERGHCVIWFGGDEYEGLTGGYSWSDGVLRDPDGGRIETRPIAKPAMELLHAPVQRGWGAAAWREWSESSDRQFKEMQRTDWPEFSFDDWLEQRHAAWAWAAPAELAVAFGDREPQLYDSTRTVASVIHQFCQAEGFERVQYHWTLHWTPEPGSLAASMAETDAHCPWRKDLFQLELTTGSTGSEETLAERLWSPKTPERWLSEHQYVVRIEPKQKVLPAAPTERPAMDKLGSAPPANGTAAEWKEWCDSECCGGYDYWKQRNAALSWACPSSVQVTINGIGHSHTMEVAADDPLSRALEEFCQRVQSVGSGPELSPPEYLVRDTHDELVDLYCHTARQLFRGAHNASITLSAVPRSSEKRKQAHAVAEGDVPAGWKKFRGSAFLLEVHETAWLVGPDGQATIDHLEQHLKGEAGIRRYDEADDVYGVWEEDLCRIRQVLTHDIMSVWDKDKQPVQLGSTQICQTCDKVTGLMLKLIANSWWAESPDGRSYFRVEAAERQALKLAEQIDTILAKTLKAALAQDGAIKGSFLTLKSHREQIERLVQKTNRECQGLKRLRDPPFRKAAKATHPKMKKEPLSTEQAAQKQERAERAALKRAEAKREAEASGILGKEPMLPTLPQVPDAKDRQFQLRISYTGYMPGSLPNQKERQEMDNKVWREIIVSGASTLHDLMKTAVTALGLHESSRSVGYGKFNHAPGTGKTPKLIIYDLCHDAVNGHSGNFRSSPEADGAKFSQCRIAGLEYGTAKSKHWHTSKALKAVKVAQLFDKSMCSDEDLGVGRMGVLLLLQTDKKAAFVPPYGGLLKLAEKAYHDICIECVHISKKPSKLQLQAMHHDHPERMGWDGWGKALPRCVGGKGQVPDGNSIEWEVGADGQCGDDIDALNESFHNGRQVHSIFGNGGFWSIRAVMRQPIVIVEGFHQES